MNTNNQPYSNPSLPTADEFEKYNKTSSLIRAIQRPCVIISSFCISFILFNFLIFRNSFPMIVWIVLSGFAFISLLAVFITGYIEKKLFREFMFKLNAKTQEALKKRKGIEHGNY